MSLCDAFGAERDVDVLPESFDELLHHGRDPRVDGASQHEELSVDEALSDLRDRGLNGVQVGIVVLIDRGPDHDHHGLGASDGLRLSGSAYAAAVEDAGEDLFGTRLREWDDTPVHLPARSCVAVDELDLEAPIGEHETERKTYVAAATNDRDIYR
jgi:hypothetical protein